jgi:hypothetical protein
MNQQSRSSTPAGKPDYDALFSRPILPPDLPFQTEKPNFFYRTRNSLWWVIVFLIVSSTALAFMKSDFIVDTEVESGCGDSSWWSFFTP